MSSFRRSHKGTLQPTWHEALALANMWAKQLNRRHRVRAIRLPSSWAWKVERSNGRIWE